MLRRLTERLRGEPADGSQALALVQSVAEELLGRHLDEPRATALAQRVAARPGELGAVVRELLASDEARQRSAPQRLLDSDALTARTTFVSLGTHCFTAALLKRWGLKRWSGPFDWLFASPSMLAHAFGDDFATLLDPAQYRPVPVEARVNGPDVNRVDHAFYREKHGVAFVFNHHDVHLEADYAYLTRCVERLRQAQRAPGHKTFLLFRHLKWTRLEDIHALHRAMAAGTGNFRLCVFLVEPEPLQTLPQAEAMVDEPTLGVWRYRPASTWQPLYFESPLDEAAVLHLASPA